MGAIRQRQYIDSPPWYLSHSLERALQYMRVVLQSVPRRRAKVDEAKRPPVIVATDAQADSHPTAGFLSVDLETGKKSAGFMRFSDEFLHHLGYAVGWMEAGLNPIAQCDAAIVLTAFLTIAPANRDVIAFIDKSVALHCMVKGTSTNAAIDRTVHLVHLLAFVRGIRIWFEFVPSEQNWADGVSRNGLNDQFVRNHDFEPIEPFVEPKLWSHTLIDAWDLLNEYSGAPAT